MQEEWKQFRDTRYDVSNMGRVRSTLRPDKLGNIRKNQAGIMKLQPKNNGYLQVQLSGKWYAVHRLVAEVFMGLPEDKSMVVDHIDSNKQNNQLTNLQWLSTKDNVKKAYRDGRVPKKSEKELIRSSKMLLKINEEHKIRIKVFDKTNKTSLVFDSNQDAAKYYNKNKSYFSELYTKRGGENRYFKVERL